MMNKKLLGFLVILLLAPLIIWAAYKQGGKVGEKVATSHARYDGPALWKVTDKDSTLYLFGTVHILPKDTHWQRRDLLTAFGEVGNVWFETPDDDKSALKATLLQREYGLYPSGKRISDMLDGADLNRLTAAAYNVKIPLQSLQSFKPWLVGDLLVAATVDKIGMSYDNAPDIWLREKAKAEHKSIHALDDVETYFKAVGGQPEIIQLKALKATLDKFDQLEQNLIDVNAAWIIGNIDRLERELLRPAQEKSPEIYKALFTDRNRTWTQKLDTFLKGDTDGLVVVGIGHLIGDDGLPKRLEDLGYKVERVRRTDLPNVGK